VFLLLFLNLICTDLKINMGSCLTHVTAMKLTKLIPHLATRGLGLFHIVWRNNNVDFVGIVVVERP
jgi:hypothetical protein